MTHGNPGNRPGRVVSEDRRPSRVGTGAVVPTVLCYRRRGAVAVIALPPRADAECILALLRHSEQALVAGNRLIAVDLSATDRLDTRTLGELGVALRAISRHRVAVTVVGADPRIRQVLELCEIEGLGFHRTIRGARAAAHARPPRAIRLPRRDVLRRRAETDGSA